MNKKSILLLSFLLFSVSTIFSQEKSDTITFGWSQRGNIGLNFAQTSLTNWSAGGNSSVAGNALFNGALYYRHGNLLWQNTLGLEYGLTNVKSEGTKKTTDRIDFASQLGYTTNNIWYYSALADFKTQFYNGYNYPDKTPISKFMAPAYSTVSIGMEYRPSNKFYSIYVSPLAGKFTFVRDQTLSDNGSFGVEKGKKFRAELGAYAKAKAEKTIMENVKLMTDVNLFTAYDKSFGNIDVEWNVLLNMKINKFLNATVNTTLKYDDDVKYINSNNEIKGARIQFKEMIGVGLGYQF